MSAVVLPYGFRSKSSGVGISVAKAKEARVSIIRFTHNICTAYKWKCKEILAYNSVYHQNLIEWTQMKTFDSKNTLSGESSIAQAPINATTTATTLTVSWNCRNLAMLSYTFLPHITAFTMLLKLSSVKMISEASFATSVPAIPYFHYKILVSHSGHNYFI